MVGRIVGMVEKLWDVRGEGLGIDGGESLRRFIGLVANRSIGVEVVDRPATAAAATAADGREAGYLHLCFDIHNTGRRKVRVNRL